ncbi:MspA family porin [Mycolicibacterium sp. HS_4_1]
MPALLGIAGGAARADPLPVAGVRHAVNTEDGWRLGVSLIQMTVDSVPNMAATAFIREGFVTGRARRAAGTVIRSAAVPCGKGVLHRY